MTLEQTIAMFEALAGHRKSDERPRTSPSAWTFKSIEQFMSCRQIDLSQLGPLPLTPLKETSATH